MKKSTASTLALAGLGLAMVTSTALGACGGTDTTSTATGTETSTASSSSASSGGGAGGTTHSATANVAIGGCYDLPGCGVPSDDLSGCVPCSLTGDCKVADDACKAEPECAALRQCVIDCGKQSCIDTCTTQHPNGAATYRKDLECGYCACSLTDVCTPDKAAAKPPITCP